MFTGLKKRTNIANNTFKWYLFLNALLYKNTKTLVAVSPIENPQTRELSDYEIN